LQAADAPLPEKLCKAVRDALQSFDITLQHLLVSGPEDTQTTLLRHYTAEPSQTPAQAFSRLHFLSVFARTYQTPHESLVAANLLPCAAAALELCWPQALSPPIAENESPQEPLYVRLVSDLSAWLVRLHASNALLSAEAQLYRQLLLAHPAAYMLGSDLLCFLLRNSDRQRQELYAQNVLALLGEIRRRNRLPPACLSCLCDDFIPRLLRLLPEDLRTSFLQRFLIEPCQENPIPFAYIAVYLRALHGTLPQPVSRFLALEFRSRLLARLSEATLLSPQQVEASLPVFLCAIAYMRLMAENKDPMLPVKPSHYQSSSLSLSLSNVNASTFIFLCI
jgi:hypothetical protein